MSSAEYHAQWEGHWGSEESVQPGKCWDAEWPAPSLVNYLASPEGKPLVEGKTALVPGCGRGYDLVALHKAGASKVVGIEISKSAARVAREYVAKEAPDADSQVIEFDWLDLSASVDEKFDLGYDYTFFCALHPSMRADWAKGWAARLRPGGAVITLMFPLEPEGRSGPPWPVSEGAYAEVLELAGFKCTYAAAVSQHEATRKDRFGREKLAVWVKQ